MPDNILVRGKLCYSPLPPFISTFAHPAHSSFAGSVCFISVLLGWRNPIGMNCPILDWEGTWLEQIAACQQGRLFAMLESLKTYEQSRIKQLIPWRGERISKKFSYGRITEFTSYIQMIRLVGCNMTDSLTRCVLRRVPCLPNLHTIRLCDVGEFP